MSISLSYFFLLSSRKSSEYTLGVRELSHSIVHACSLSRDVVGCLRWKPVDMRTFSSFLLSFTAAWLSAVAVQRPVDIKNRPRIPIPDEDPYSVASNELENSGASGSSGEIGRERIAVTKEHLMQQMNGKRSEKPPKLPPRDNIYPQVRVVRVSDTPTGKRKNLLILLWLTRSENLSNFKFHVRFSRARHRHIMDESLQN